MRGVGTGPAPMLPHRSEHIRVLRRMRKRSCRYGNDEAVNTTPTLPIAMLTNRPATAVGVMSPSPTVNKRFGYGFFWPPPRGGNQARPDHVQNTLAASDSRQPNPQALLLNDIFCGLPSASFRPGNTRANHGLIAAPAQFRIILN